MEATKVVAANVKSDFLLKTKPANIVAQTV